MPTVNLRPNSSSLEFMSLDIEASPAEDDEPAGLALTLDNNEGHHLAVWETNAGAIREFRDMVIQECTKALELIESN